MLHPDTELRWTSQEVGWGVYATRDIPRGTLTWVQDPLDQVLTPAAVAALPPMLQAQADRYGFVDGQGRTVICWDLARYVNHHCCPNSIGGGLDFDVAVRRISAGDEITTDYAQLNLDRPFQCACGWRRCRGVVAPTDFEWLVPRWDRRVERAMRAGAHVEQPLWGLVADPVLVQAIAQGAASLPSVTAHRFSPPGERSLPTAQ